MYHYTDEQLESMKKVEASRASRIENLHARMTAEEKDAVLAEFHPDYITSAYEELKVGKNKGGKVLHELADLLQGHSRIKDMKSDLTKIDYDVVHDFLIFSFHPFHHILPPMFKLPLQKARIWHSSPGT